MNISDIKQCIIRESEELRNLAKDLSDLGEPLSSNKKEVIRRVLTYTWLKDVSADMEISFIRGNRDQFVNSFEEALETLQKLI